MAETKTVEFKTLEELFEKLKPKKVFVAVERNEGDDTETTTARTTEAIVRISAFDTKIKITSCGVISVPVKEGDAQILPKFAFVDKKMTWVKAKKSDVSVVFRLNGDILVIEAKDVPPYTKLA